MKIRRVLLSTLVLPLCLCASAESFAGGGPLGIDHRVTFDDRGIWSRHVQLGLIYTMLATEGGIALWEGGETRLGKTAWQSIDSTVLTTAMVLVAKPVFSRERPETTDDPDQWFQGNGNDSFPSGEASLTSTIVTPFVLEYGKEHPAVYALELLPVYDAIARVRTRGHWQTDVLAGLALGTAVGYFMHEREMPLVLGVLPHGFEIGFSKRW